MKSSIQTICQQYLTVFPQEQEALIPLTQQLMDASSGDITSRKTFTTGHVTAGAIIVALPSKAVLLLDHVVLKKQLQPGGHVEPEDDTMLAAALRECQEETGIPPTALTYIPLTEQNKDVPFAIGVQDIPASEAKAEPEHNHYDFWYLFTVDDGVAVASDDTGVANHQWVAFDVFAERPEFARQAEKVEKLLLTTERFVATGSSQ